MEKYNFLLKPLFFIFSLLFATWLVIKIENLSPSDFGRYKSFFEKPAPALKDIPVYDKYYIMQLAEDYKAGRINKQLFDQELTKYLISVKSRKVPDK